MSKHSYLELEEDNLPISFQKIPKKKKLDKPKETSRAKQRLSKEQEE